MESRKHASAATSAMAEGYVRRLPVGAEPANGRGTHFRVWAPASRTAAIEVQSARGAVEHVIPLRPEEDGYFSGFVDRAVAGARYKIKLERGSFPDPASRFQPEGPHGSSQVIDPHFNWTDTQWRGRPMHEFVIYELHLGTFTGEGTWRAAMEQLPGLARLGITMIEVMPVADFPGKFGWGYDGVDLFAPARLYGTPEDMRAFVDRAHALGVGVILDVVYNHFGPDGCYLREFSKDYFSTRYANEWGEPLNFDGERSGPVREFFAANARYWIEEFHLDGLRFDATQQIFDASAGHILAELARAAHAAGGDRRIYVIGENEPQHPQLVRPAARGGYELDVLWNDDFHHAARVAATGRAEAYYSGYRGAPQEFISCAKYGYLYQGQWDQWQKGRRGRPGFDLRPENFVIFLENHDQVANTAGGLRLHQLTSPGRLRALTALLLLSPQIPMLFQGQEFGSSTPFLYFADHNPELAQLVAQGRAKFMSQFAGIAAERSPGMLPNPGAMETFQRCALDPNERESRSWIHRLHCDLLKLRRDESVVVHAARIDGAVLGPDAFVLRYFSADGDDRILFVNFGADLGLTPAPEPLLAPLENRGWRVIWSSESPAYAGAGTAPLETTSNWRIPGNAAVFLGPDENCELPRAKISQKD